jgi:hypothetical protein
MPRYTLEIQVNTAESILMLVDGVAQEFTIRDHSFKSAVLDFDQRPGYRYFVSKIVEADTMFKAYDAFMNELSIVTDAIAYYYSQPVSVEFWNILIKKEGDENAYFSGYSLRPTTSMTDYNDSSPELIDIIEKAENSEELRNSLWIYNNIAKVDSVDYDPSSHQFGLCQLVESLAEKDEMAKCETCGQGGYTRTSRRDIKAILDRDLYDKLYGGSDILRNRLGHGNLVGGTFLTNDDVEETILKVTERMKEKYEITNKVTSSMTDRIRGTNVWNGATYGIKHKDMGLEECLQIHNDESIRHERGPIPTGW